MRIQYLNGGLANQVFQYIFMRFAQIYAPDNGPWFLDDSLFFVNQVHNGYELEKVFGIRPNLLSRHFDDDIWQEFIRNKENGISIAQSFMDLGFSIEMIAETSNYTTHNPFNGKVYSIPSNEFHPEIIKFPGEAVYYHGYWIHPKWFRTYQDIFKKELSFPPLTDERNQEYARQILSSKSIGVHIRRGDYVTIGWALSHTYYLDAAKKISTEHPDAVFFVFSDDLDWCRSNAASLGLNLPSQTVYVEGNTRNSSFRDLQLMSMCYGLLMSNSAFCYLAALLNERMEVYWEPPH